MQTTEEEMFHAGRNSTAFLNVWIAAESLILQLQDREAHDQVGAIPPTVAASSATETVPASLTVAQDTVPSSELAWGNVVSAFEGGNQSPYAPQHLSQADSA